MSIEKRENRAEERKLLIQNYVYYRKIDLVLNVRTTELQHLSLPPSLSLSLSLSAVTVTV